MKKEMTMSEYLRPLDKHQLNARCATRGCRKKATGHTFHLKRGVPFKKSLELMQYPKQWKAHCDGHDAKA